MKAIGVTVAGMGLCCFMVIAAASPQTQQDESNKKVQGLQKERLATLSDMSDVASALYRNARATFDEVYDVKHQLLSAQIEAAQSQAERIKLLEDFVTLMKGYEEMTQAQKAAAQGNHLSVLKAKMRRIEAEIALEQARDKPGK